MERLLEAAQPYGLIPSSRQSIHGLGVKSIKHKALSVDHLELMNDEDIEALKVVIVCQLYYHRVRF